MRRQSSADQAQVGKAPGQSKVVMFTATATQKGTLCPTTSITTKSTRQI